MKDRSIWNLSTAVLVFALLLGLSGLAMAEESAAPPAAAASVAAAASPEVPIIDKAAAVSPYANHYKCYPVRESSGFRPRTVKLRDQFGDVKASVLAPRYLCNPVRKTTEDGSVYEPPLPESHLVCYEIRESDPTPRWEVLTEDQFGELKLVGDAAELLCLPAAKRIIIPPGG